MDLIHQLPRASKTLRPSRPRKRLAILGGGVLRIPTLEPIIDGLASQYDVTIYSENRHREERTAGYPVRSVPAWHLPPLVRVISFGLMVVIRQWLNRPDLIYAHSTFPSGLAAIVAGRLFGIPVLVGLDAGEGVGLPEIGFGSLLKERRTRINRLVLKHTQSVFVLTAFHAELVRRNLGVAPQKIHVIPRGLDLSRFSFADRPVRMPVRFLNVAYMHPVKDQETLLRCFAILRRRFPCSLTLVGKDHWNERIKDLSEELGIERHVDFKGFVPYEGMPAVYREADILLHTSRYESMAMAVVEAMASGLLVCGTRVGLMADLSGHCCLTVPPRDHGQLADIVERLLEDQVEVDRLRRNGRAWVEEHDREWSVGRLVAVLEAHTR